MRNKLVNLLGIAASALSLSVLKNCTYHFGSCKVNRPSVNVQKLHNNWFERKLLTEKGFVQILHKTSLSRRRGGMIDGNVVSLEWVCAWEKWYNIRPRHERRNAHAETE